MTDLAVTKRCEEDDLSALPPDEAMHVLEVFQERRGLGPQSGETMHGVGGPLRKLHADMAGGRSIRAVTWYDQGNDLCWLLAAGRHDDIYGLVEKLARKDQHLPTAQDVANFQADAPVRAMERVVRSARKALEAAIANPGVEIPVTTSLRQRLTFSLKTICYRFASRSSMEGAASSRTSRLLLSKSPCLEKRPSQWNFRRRAAFGIPS